MYRWDHAFFSTFFVTSGAREHPRPLVCEQVHTVVIPGLTPNVRSHVQVGKKRVTVDWTKWISEYGEQHT